MFNTYLKKMNYTNQDTANSVITKIEIKITEVSFQITFLDALVRILLTVNVYFMCTFTSIIL